MKRIISLFLCLIFFTATSLSLVSCVKDENPTNDKEHNPPPSTITVPEYRDYERGTVDFSKILYKRPDVSAIIENFSLVCEKISENSISYDDQLGEIYALEEDYNEFLTMLTYANIKTSKDNTDLYWSAEYEALSTAYPSFSSAVEDLFVAAAKSPHAIKFEEDYFGENLIEDYKDGGKYTDEAVLLMEREAELEAEYQSLSTATVIISYAGRQDTVDNLLDYYKNLYKTSSSSYKRAEKDCMELYEAAVNSSSKEILVELFKLRRRIADELEYDSYREFAYETIYHDYGESDFLAFAEDISEFVLPVYIELSNRIFNQKANQKPRKVSRTELINNTYEAFLGTSDTLSTPFSYMLQHGLYEIDALSEKRFQGAYTSYLDIYNAPFIFASTGESLSDYASLSHEFGHFVDAYYNYNSNTSLDLSEVSSQALELLMVSKFEGILSDDDVDFLLLSEMESLLSTIIFQGFYSVFEHIAYDIPLDKISPETLNAAVALAADKVGLNSSYIDDIEFVLIPHILLYPFYVQSYCTSAAVALEIYFTELENEGAGFEVYEKLVLREEDDLAFTQYIENAGLASPFEKDRLKTLADKVHFKLRGSHYFIGIGNGNTT